ncbi:MAG TPA: hypothetical protein VG269_29615, partial [Tepidisphaeraceae bacterium]|nr:hypothetical protein [Tepidisphaeraceae bacterium]
DVNVTSAAPITAIRAGFWGNGDSVSEAVKAPYVRLVHAFGNFTPGLQLTGAGAPAHRALGQVVIPGAIGGTWNVPSGLSSLTVGDVSPDFNGTFAGPLGSFTSKTGFTGTLTAPSIGSLKVRANINLGHIHLTGPYAAGKFDLKTVVAPGGIAESEIFSAGSIGTISAATLSNSLLYAGVATLPAGQVLPETISDFVAPATIQAVTLHPKGKSVGFFNNGIAAQTLGNIQLGLTTLDYSGNPDGIIGHTIAHFQATSATPPQKFDFSNLTSAAQVTALLTSQHLTLSLLILGLV